MNLSPSATSSSSAIPDPAQAPRAFLEYLFQTAVARALPLQSMAAFLPPPPKGRTLVLGAGKAGGSMAQAVEALWPADAPLEGLVVTRYGYGCETRFVEIVEAEGADALAQAPFDHEPLGRGQFDADLFADQIGDALEIAHRQMIVISVRADGSLLGI